MNRFIINIYIKQFIYTNGASYYMRFLIDLYSVYGDMGGMSYLSTFIKNIKISKGY